MDKRREAIEQAKEYLLEQLTDDLRAGYFTIETICFLQKVLRLPVEPGNGKSMPVDLEDTEDVGIGWIEENTTDPDNPYVTCDIRPCVWFGKRAFDAESVDYDLMEEGEKWGYNHWHDGFRLWSDGKKPTNRQRIAWEWRK